MCTNMKQETEQKVANNFIFMNQSVINMLSSNLELSSA